MVKRHLGDGVTSRAPPRCGRDGVPGALVSGCEHCLIWRVVARAGGLNPEKTSLRTK